MGSEIRPTDQSHFFGTLCQFLLFQVGIVKTALVRHVVRRIPFRRGTDDLQVQSVGNPVIDADTESLFQTVTGQIGMILRRIAIGMGFLRFPHDCFIFSFKHVTANAVIAEEADVAGFALFRQVDGAAQEPIAAIIDIRAPMVQPVYIP
jgi:hypothetical protein